MEYCVMTMWSKDDNGSAVVGLLPLTKNAHAFINLESNFRAACD